MAPAQSLLITILLWESLNPSTPIITKTSRYGLRQVAISMFSNEDGTTNNLVLYSTYTVWNGTSTKGGDAPRATD